jgi:hypothetical protein
MARNNETKNVVLILSPFNALTILAALEVVQGKKDVTRSLFESIEQFTKQINEHVTTEQVDDAEAELAVRVLIGTY